jgi:hypothetical protein
MTLEGHFGKKDDIGGATRMMAADGSLAESEGAGEVRCEGGDDGDEGEGVVAVACAGIVGDVGGAGGAGESAAGEAVGVSKILASGCIEEAGVASGIRDGGVNGVGVAGKVAVVRPPGGVEEEFSFLLRFSQ